jgi:hypothetical protein
VADEGPTTVGSIDAKVGMDLDQWRAGVAEIQASARELGALSPDITVDANTGRAEAALAAVDAAANAAGDSATTSAAKFGINAAAESKLGTEGAQAAVKVTALEAAQRAAADAATRQAASETENAAATTAAGDAAGYTNSRVALLTAAVVGLALVSAPLTGTVVGLGGAFGGMGAAGVLAIVGIVAAMKDANGVGQEYSVGLQDLKGDLNSLGSTAAIGMLASFQQAVAQIDGALPSLNGQVAYFSAQLGGAGNTALAGIITALHVLNPLFIQATDYVQSLASGFAAWTANGGLEKFAQYAETTFPLVTRTLGDLVSGVVQLVEALSPVGTVVLSIIDVVAQFVGWLGSFGPALGVVAGAAAAAFAAFKLWEAVGPILSAVTTAAEAATGGVTALGIAMDAASGPIGWVIAGIAALTAAVGIGVAATQQNTQATYDYASALQQSNGALDDNIRKQVAKNLSDAGLLQTAKEYHLQLSTVTDAVLDNTDAMKKVNDAAQKYGKTLVEVHGQNGTVTNSYTTLSDKAREFTAAVNGQNSSLKDQVQAYKDQKSAAEDSANSVGTLTEQQKKLDAAQKTVTDDTTALANALSALGQVNRDADKANIQYQQNLDQATQSIKDNGRTLDETTEKGRANASALDDVATSGLNLIAAQAKQGASEQTLQSNMETTRQSFINVAEQMGLNQTDAENLATQYGLVPDDVMTTFSTSGLGDAISQVNQLQTAIDLLTSGKHEISIGGSAAGYYGFGQAYGGKVGKGHAAGGQVTGPGNALSDTAGLYIPVSNSEWIISNIQGQASRWDSMLSLVNANAPAGQIAGKAMQIAGAQAPVQTVARGPQVVHNHNWTIYTNNGEQLFQLFAARTNGAAAV